MLKVSLVIRPQQKRHLRKSAAMREEEEWQAKEMAEANANTAAATTTTTSDGAPGFQAFGRDYYEYPLRQGDVEALGDNTISLTETDITELQGGNPAVTTPPVEKSTPRSSLEKARGINVRDDDLPCEVLQDAELCVTTPAVTETWCISQSKRAFLVEGGGGAFMQDGTEVCMSEPSHLMWNHLSRSRAHSGRSARAGTGGTAPPFLCVYAVPSGASTVDGHFSESGKAMVLAATMGTLRRQLLAFLLPLSPSSSFLSYEEAASAVAVAGVSDEERQLAACIKKWCRRQDGLPRKGGRVVWRITWSCELLTATARAWSRSSKLTCEDAECEEETEESEERDARAVKGRPIQDSGHVDDDSSGEDFESLASDSVGENSYSDEESDGEERNSGVQEEANEEGLPLSPAEKISTVVVAHGRRPSCVTTIAQVPLKATALAVRHLLLRDHAAPARRAAARTFLTLDVSVRAVQVMVQSARDCHTTASLVQRLYAEYLLPAERHREYGTDGLKSAMALIANTATAAAESAHQQPPTSQLCRGEEESEDSTLELLQEALSEYHACAARAQRGVLFSYEHQLSPYASSSVTEARAPAAPGQEGEVEDMEEISRHAAYVRCQAARSARVVSPSSPCETNTTHTGGVCSARDENEEERKGHEEDAREWSVMERFSSRVLSPMQIPGEDYYNNALLYVHLDCDEEDGGASSSCGYLRDRYRALQARIVKDPLLAPARAAMFWRERPHSHVIAARMKPSGATATTTSAASSSPAAETCLQRYKVDNQLERRLCLLRLLPPPTALQWVWYALSRMLVTAASNTAQALIILCTWQQQQQQQRWPHRSSRHEFSTGITVPTAEIVSAATACEKASEVVAVYLIRCHVPYLFPSILSEEEEEEEDKERNIEEEEEEETVKAAMAELQWCYQLYCKLWVRAGRLWGLAGSEEERSGKCKAHLRECLRRWSGRRGTAEVKCTGISKQRGRLAQWSGSLGALDDLVAVLGASEWATLHAEVSAAVSS